MLDYQKHHTRTGGIAAMAWARRSALCHADIFVIMDSRLGP
jgi:hypothetical protein